MKTLFSFDENSSATFFVLGGVRRRKQRWNKSKRFMLYPNNGWNRVARNKNKACFQLDFVDIIV